MSFLSYFDLTSTLLALLIIILLYYTVNYTYKLRFGHYWKKSGLTHEPPQAFISAYYALFKGKTFQETDEELYKKYGRIFGSYEGFQPQLYISDPEYIKTILVKDFHSFVNRRELYFGDPVTDSMLTLQQNDEWKRIRTIMSPTFTTGKLKGMIPNIIGCAVQSTKSFSALADSKEPIEVKKLFGNFTLDVIANVAFGSQLDSHNDPDNVFVTEAKKAFSVQVGLKTFLSIVAPRLAVLLGLNLFESKFFSDLAYSLIDIRKRTKEVRNDFLHLMMESLEEPETNNSQSENKELLTDDKNQMQKKGLSEVEVVSQSVMFFLAGYDTTATTLAMACYNLALNPEIQKKAQQEVDAIWKKTSTIDSTTLADAKYLDAVINETLRIFPPVVRLERTASVDYTLESTGVVIPKGTLIAIPIYSMHRDPEYFPQPLQFQPERFLIDNVGSIGQFTYLPFGAGPRNCVAMRLALIEVKINLLHLLKQVEFGRCPMTEIPPTYYNGLGLLQPKSIHLQVTRRN